jgi:anti-sigma B factor antagonist
MRAEDETHTAACPPSLRVRVHRESSAVRVLVSGELDVATERHLTDRLDALVPADAPQVCLDLAAVTFCDARGLSALVRFSRRLDASGRRLSVIGAPAHMRRLLVLTSLGHLLDGGRLTEPGLPEENGS